MTTLPSSLSIRAPLAVQPDDATLQTDAAVSAAVAQREAVNARVAADEAAATKVQIAALADPTNLAAAAAQTAAVTADAARAEVAANAASASSSASTASAAATTATARAGEAAASATAASGSAATATTRVGEATTQAGIATTQAGIATTRAGEAAASATAAANSQVAAAGSATAASTSAGAAAASQTAAANSASSATTSATNAAASSTTALTARAAAEAAVASVTVGSTNSLAYPEVVKNLITANDVVDVFIYDTRLDSDGGAWTERCQHTSWFQEALNTATRGAKRAFPKVAILVARTNAFAIYDALDLDGTGTPRMWMLFNSNISGLTSVAALNGQIVLGTSALTLLRIFFPADMFCSYFSVTVNRVWTIGGRAGTSAFRKLWNSNLPSSQVNDVAMRVLPGAPIDTVSGLPIPTILAGHQAGASFIHPDDRVSSITDAGGMVRVAFLSDSYVAITRNASPSTHIGPIFYGSTIAHTTWHMRQYGSNTALAIPGSSNAFRHYIAPNGAIGSALGLTFFEHDFGNLNNSMNAQAHISHATGWMPGDIRLATLCDAATGAVVGTNLLTCDGTTNLPTALGSAVSSSGGEIVLTWASGSVGAFWDIATVVGQSYMVSGRVRRGTIAFPGVLATPAANTAEFYTTNTSGVRFNFTFVATATSTQIRLMTTNGATTGDTAFFDDISVDIAAPGFAVRQEGARVVGTLSRNAVSAGADIAAFSGFSTANYLEQPYSPMLDFADADFAIIGWFQRSATTAAEVLLERDSAATGPRFTLMLDATASTLRFTTDDDTDVVAAIQNANVPPDDGIWHQFVCVKRGTTQELWVDGALAATANAAAVGSLNNAAAVLRLGCDVAGTMPFGGSLAMVRATAYAPTRAQIERMHFDERPLFEANAKAFIGGTSTNVVAVDFSRMTRRLAAATGDGVSVFSGLRRVEYLDSAVAPGAIANDTMRAVSLEGGVIAFATTANAGARRDAVIGMDRLQATPPIGWAPRAYRQFGVTIDATPTVLVPRVHVGERETLLLQANIVGRTYGSTDTQRFSFIRRATAYRDASGNVTLHDAVQVVGEDTEVTTSADATIVVDTLAQTVAVQVTGVAATRIVWRAEVSVTRVSDVTSYEETV